MFFIETVHILSLTFFFQKIEITPELDRSACFRQSTSHEQDQGQRSQKRSASEEFEETKQNGINGTKVSRRSKRKRPKNNNTHEKVPHM